MTNFNDEPPSLKERFDELLASQADIRGTLAALHLDIDRIDKRFDEFRDDGAEFGEKLWRDREKLFQDLELMKVALGMMLGGAVGKGAMKGDIEKLVDDLGFKPASDLLVGVR